MELELKILKEKVVDDEKNSGIGALFDDQKSSNEHIDQLKIKYADMKKNFEQIYDRMNDKMIDVKGNQQVLHSQKWALDALRTELEIIFDKEKDEWDGKTKNKLKEVNTAGTARSALDTEVR